MLTEKSQEEMILKEKKVDNIPTNDLENRPQPPFSDDNIWNLDGFDAPKFIGTEANLELRLIDDI